MQNIAQRLLDEDCLKSSDIRGCSQDEVKIVESYAGHTLPEIYKDFLFTFGHGIGNLFEGIDISFKDLLKFRIEAEELLRENGNNFKLPDNVFIFSFYQGYQFMYFPFDPTNEDPPIYRYIEGAYTAEKKWNHFSEYILGCVEEYIKQKKLRY